jgi:hypothetical protein
MASTPLRSTSPSPARALEGRCDGVRLPEQIPSE